MSKFIIFLVKSFLGNFYRHLAIFFWSQCPFISFYALPIPFRKRRSWTFQASTKTFILCFSLQEFLSLSFPLNRLSAGHTTLSLFLLPNLSTLCFYLSVVHTHTHNPSSVTSTKLPNVYKSCPKMA